VNRAFTQITGYTEDEVIGKHPGMLSSGRHGLDFYAEMWESINNTGTWEGEVWNRRKNGEIYPEYLTFTSSKRSGRHSRKLRGDHGRHYPAQVSGRGNSASGIYDSLTGLPNRRLLHGSSQNRRLLPVHAAGETVHCCFLTSTILRP